MAPDADRQGLDVLLAAPGNRLVPIRVPLDQGIPIGPCVTQRKIKIDQHTHRLAERKAFSSRHCLDGARHSGMLRQAGQSYDVETASTVADDVLIKCLIADAAVRRRRLLKADVPNAYSHGKRLGRPLAYMSLPDTLADELLDDEGRRQCTLSSAHPRVARDLLASSGRSSSNRPSPPWAGAAPRACPPSLALRLARRRLPPHHDCRRHALQRVGLLGHR